MAHVQDTVRGMFTREQSFARWLEVEAALADAQAALGIIPPEAARAIAAAAKPQVLALEEYDDLYARIRHPLVPLLRLLERAAGEHGQYIHYGATTQDILDTALMLALRRSWDAIRGGLTRIEALLAALCEEHADTIMAGRTHNIQALPITFGFKAASWLWEVRRSIARMEAAQDTIFVLQLSGAVGTLASFGDSGFPLQREVAARLGLSVPEISWQASRDRYGEFTAVLALAAGGIARIAQEVYLLMMTEIGELREGRGSETVGSSTMPHKVNPVDCQHILALNRALRGNAAHMLELLAVDHERNMAGSIDEQELLEDSCVRMGELLTRAETMLEGLEVDAGNMLRNLRHLGGLMQSEAVMLGLGEKTGKQRAHEIVGEIALAAQKSGEAFSVLLLRDKRVTDHLPEEEIRALLDPRAYTGYAADIARAAARGEKLYSERT